MKFLRLHGVFILLLLFASPVFPQIPIGPIFSDGWLVNYDDLSGMRRDTYDRSLLPEAVNLDRYKRGGLCLNFDCATAPRQNYTIVIGNHNRSNDVVVSRYDSSRSIYMQKMNTIAHMVSIIVGEINDLESLSTSLYLAGKDTLVDLKYYCIDSYDIYYGLGYAGYNPLMYCPLKYLPFTNGEVKFNLYSDIVAVQYDHSFWVDLLKRYEGHELSDLQCDTLANEELYARPWYLQYFGYDECTYQKCSIGMRNRSLRHVKKDEIRDMFLDSRIQNPLVGCELWLSCAREKYDILFHRGDFPAGDCDLRNWRGLKLGELTTEEQKFIARFDRLVDFPQKGLNMK